MKTIKTNWSFALDGEIDFWRLINIYTDFDNIKDFSWLFKKFPDFSLMVATVLFKSFYISEGFADRWMSWPGLHITW